MVDAAGAIYVIGGTNGTGGITGYNDVWASTDGGARAGLAPGWWGVLGVLGVLAGYLGVPRGLWGTRSTRGVV
jgi:hypothetical protein